jgi:hypothetical protein
MVLLSIITGGTSKLRFSPFKTTLTGSCPRAEDEKRVAARKTAVKTDINLFKKPLPLLWAQ